MAASDQHLVEQALAGNPSAFGDLAERYVGLVRGVVWEALRRPDEVDDVVQEVFGHAYAHLVTLRQHGRFVPWLWQITANAVVDHQRQRQRCQVGLTDPEAGLALHLKQPDQVVEEDDASRLIWEALDRLEPRRRRIVVLYYFEQCSQSQIARFLGLSVPTIKLDLIRARRQLRDDLFVLLGEEVQARRQSRHRLRERLAAVLPVTPWLRPAPPTGWIARIVGWAGLPLALVASLGLHGLLGLGVVRLGPARGTPGIPVGTIRLRLIEPPAIPATVQARPERPRLGETVQLEAPGASLTGSGQRAFVHYVTSPLATVESVVPMERQGDRWIAEVRLPAGAVALFYAISDQAAPQELRPFSGDPGWMRQLGQYRGSVLTHDAQGRPVRDAEYTAAEMALMAGRPFAEVKAHLDRETTLYPDNVRAWNEGWFQSLRTDSTARVRVQSEQRALLARFADRPELLFALGQAAGPDLPESYPELRRRFPAYPRTAELAYLWSRYYALERDST
ncbi:MAG: sigma-70 family RNA polymerase sigma factor, partial [Candidatus Latescibacterota bacterium]